MERITYRKTLDVHKNGVQFLLQGFETADNMSRVIEVSFMASGDAIDFPLERVVAMMYVTSPGATEPSINNCTIVDNKVVYEVLPITTEGITEMQIKLIETSPEGAKSVLASAKFAVEVSKSGMNDDGEELKTTFTALEDAVSKAKATYDERFLRMELTSDCIFKAYYADGSVYETDVIRRLLLENTSELDLDALVKNGIANFTADEVSVVLDQRYKNLFGKAVSVSDLLRDYPEPMFIHWDSETENTPYKAGLTTCTEGFALEVGTIEGEHTIVAWTMGGNKLESFHHYINGGIRNGWKTLLVNLTNEVDGILKVENGGTGGNTAEDAQKNLGIAELISKKTSEVKTEIMELLNGVVLWENPNATIAFDAQTIELDLTRYKRLLVVLKSFINSDDYEERTMSEKGSTYVLRFSNSSYYRDAIFTEAGIEFFDAKDSVEKRNSYCIPWKVYGFKW